MIDRPGSNHASRNGSPLRPAYATTASYRPDNVGVADDVHPVFHEGRVAVITGAASGIGHAAALELARLKMKIAIADIDEANLQKVGKEVAAIIGDANLLVIPTDVSQLDQVVHLKDKVYEAWGEVAVLMNNAGIGAKGTSWDGLDNWKKVFDINVFGVVNVQQTFVPAMIHQENEAVVINTGSKQGITNPPGNAAYNASKAAVKSLTEGLAYELRERPDPHVTAHLFVHLTAPNSYPHLVLVVSLRRLLTLQSPGWTFTGLAGAKVMSTKPDGAWSAQETVLYMLDKVRAGDFYVLVPDNETRREMDELRIMWTAGDIVEGRPALSRWHRDYKALFEEYMREGLGVSSESGRSF
ncbi:hypothetical protein PQX77_009659 [Marasmius sp. AFHP31]|nr:hypothetical protein PQX77_009659 [Marasmius sp. AFHP31]